MNCSDAYSSVWQYLSKIFEHVHKILFKDQKSSKIVRIENYFINQPGDIILAEAVAVDQRAQSFYIIVTVSKDKTTIRLDPTANPEKIEVIKVRNIVLLDGALLLPQLTDQALFDLIL